MDIDNDELEAKLGLFSETNCPLAILLHGGYGNPACI